jgi:hypothetical protein
MIDTKAITDIEAIKDEIYDLRAHIEGAEKSLRILAEDWSKQRAMNEELLEWIRRGAQPIQANRLAESIRETRKP